MTEEHGKWDFSNDEDRRDAIIAEAQAQAEVAEHNAKAASKWWLFWIVAVVILGGVQIVGMVTGNHSPSLMSLTFGKDK